MIEQYTNNSSENITRNRGKRKPALVIIFNHQHIENVPKLAKFYRNRFSRMYFIVPFVEDVPSWQEKYKEYHIIPAHFHSHYFPFGIINGFRDYQSEDTSHYIFCADDLLLNPEVNEDNYQRFFKIDGQTSYLNDYFNLPNAYSLLPWKPDNFITHAPSKQKGESNIGALRNIYDTFRKRFHRWHMKTAVEFQLGSKVLQAPQSLPSREAAIETFANYNLITKHFNSKRASAWQRLRNKYLKFLKAYRIYMIPAIANYLVTGKDSYRPLKLEYPFAGGFSDIFIIPHSKIEKFILYCGYFSAAKIFCEIAIPTAMLLSQKHIYTKKNLDLKVYEHTWWDKNYPMPEKAVENLSSITKDWPKEYLYIHPIKLSELNQ